MGSLDFQDILMLLAPGTGQVLVWSLFLYVIFFFALITLLVMPDKNMVPTLLIATVLLFAIIGKLSVTAPRSQAIFRPTDFGMYVINVGMFVFPFISIGMVRARKNKTVAPALVTALAGGVYFFLYWLIVQRAA